MSVSALNASFAVLRTGFYGILGLGLLGNIIPSSFYRNPQRINSGAIFDFAQSIVNSYKIKKEVVLIKGAGFYYAGNNALPGSAFLMVPDGAILSGKTIDEIKLKLAGIALNAGLIGIIIPMIIAIAARCLLSARFPTGATLAELGIGTIAFFASDYGFQYAAEKWV